MNADLGMIGLAVMGQNLAQNAASKGFVVAAYNRTPDRTRALAERVSRDRIVPTYTLAEFVDALACPRAILVMVKAGPAVDEVLTELFPLLAPGDLVMDGGNTFYADTDRRLGQAEARGLLYLGVGISGGESGALHGPAIMAGGHRLGYERVKRILEAIAARGSGGPCCGYFGPGSAGHYVKMVHNGIEYAIMQALAEAYDLMNRGLGMSALEMADVFGDWNRGELSSYLVEITEAILRRTDSATGKPLVDLVQDTAQQKGTGKWSTQSALDVGTPAPTIAASVFARIASALKAEREVAASVLPGPSPRLSVDRDEFLADLYGAVYLAVVAAYAQGLRQLRDASREHGYDLSPAEVARVWTAGCIIRARMLEPIRDALVSHPELPLLFLAEPFRSAWNQHQPALRRVVVTAHQHGIPAPVLGSALDFVDAYRTARLPANLIQAQRDFFGAHTYERVDKPGTFHTEWGTCSPPRRRGRREKRFGN
jgi:6-phosphogluconate dehydrogenase